MAAKSSTLAKPERLASTAEVAEVLGIPEKTLVEWRSQNKGPEYMKVGRYVRYRWSAVNAWLDTRKASKACGPMTARSV